LQSTKKGERLVSAKRIQKEIVKVVNAVAVIVTQYKVAVWKLGCGEGERSIAVAVS
jgi:hypothetical protein